MPKSEKKKYKRNFLSQVICQLTFSSHEQISEDTLKTFKTSLGDEYSELSIIKQQGIIIENDGSQIISHAEDSYLWKIESTDKTHAITITHESFAITHTSYTKFRDYIQVVTRAQKLFFEQFSGVVAINRTGLRYINQIVVDELTDGWQQYINKQLTAAFDFVESSKLRRSMHSLSLQHDDDTKVNINYGLFNEYFPAAIVNNEFILDIDTYIDVPQKFDECVEHIERFNKVIAVYFEQSITDELRNIMGVIENEAD